MNEGRARFAELSEEYVGRPGCTTGTMMGFPCLRRDGGYFVSVHKTGESMIIKVSSERVQELIEQGLGQPFAPGGRTFREWCAIPTAQSETWPERAEEAWLFAAP